VTSKGAGGWRGGKGVCPKSPGSQSDETQYELGGNEIWEATCGHSLLWAIIHQQLADFPVSGTDLKSRKGLYSGRACTQVLLLYQMHQSGII
jgi:hypothetical protein